METRAASSKATPQTKRGHTTSQRKNARRYRDTPLKKRTPTPRSSPYRCSKSPRKASQSPMKLRGDEGEGDSGRLVSKRILADMETEKRSYLGSLQWAEQEERLFEILFLRQEIPLLPPHWEVDFRGVPISGDCFCWTKGVKPVVYAHTNDFRATTALTRLIDLTANVRTACQSGLRRRTPLMIKKSLDKYLSWAAEDGGYIHLKYTPNITVEVVDKAGERDLKTFVETRMGELARSHRELLAIQPEQQDSNSTADMDVDREVEMQIKSEVEASNGQPLGRNRSRSWKTLGSLMMSKLFRLMRRSVIKPESHGETSIIDSDNDESVQLGNLARDRVRVKREEEEEMQIVVKKELLDDSDDDITMADIPMASAALSSSVSPASYLRPPPVIFGFFIVATSVFLLTADSSKDDSAMNVSPYVELDFQDRGQSVWNALTVAIAACLARDDMMKRVGDFEEERVVEESDPDA